MIRDAILGDAAALGPLLHVFGYPVDPTTVRERPDGPHAVSPFDPQEKTVPKRAVGPFDVTLIPQAPEAAGGPFGRMLIDKQFHGDLEATSKGQMLAAGTPTKGSAGYVALEEVTGTLAGRRGTFLLQHSGTMNRGVAALALAVVPDSGTGELVGLLGSMMIIIADGKHSYEFDYTLTRPA